MRAFVATPGVVLTGLLLAAQPVPRDVCGPTATDCAGPATDNCCAPTGCCCELSQPSAPPLPPATATSNGPIERSTLGLPAPALAGIGGLLDTGTRHAPVRGASAGFSQPLYALSHAFLI